MTINIFHTNDIHGNYDFLRKVHAYLSINRKENDLYLDSGDFTDLKDLIVQADGGESAMEILMSCGLDAIAVGNNETDLGNENLSKLSKKFPVITSNITDNEDTDIPGFSPYKIFERMGKKILVLGLSPFYSSKMLPGGYNVFTMMNNLKTQVPEVSARKVLDALKGQYDYCVLLSHSGTKQDEYILKFLPEVDLVLGGHSHEIITKERYTQSGKGEGIGIVTLDIEENGIKIVRNKQISINEIDDAINSFDNLLKEKTTLANEILSRELPVCEELEFNPYEESPLTNFLCDCMHKHFGGDLAIMHAGISNKALKRPVSKKSLVETFPSKLNPTTIHLSGDKILEAVKCSFDERLIHEEGTGAGFRGYTLGTLGYSSNVSITKAPFSMQIDGIEVDPQKEYTVILDDYLQRGTGYPSLKVPNEEATFDKWFIRDMVEYFLCDEEVFKLSKIKRIK